jgi:hypothetical protein
MNQTPDQLTFQMPPGYTALTALDRVKHAGKIAASPDYSWCGKLNSVFVNLAEMGKACPDYPIAFVRETNSGEYLPVILLSLRSGENLYVGSDGKWEPRTYVPAYMRRYPFCLVEMPDQGGGEPQRLILVEENKLVPSDKPYFDAKGEATPEWQPVQDLIELMERARQETRAFTRRLEAFGLFVPFDALATPRSGGQSMRLQGLHRVDEEKLNALGTREQKLLMRKGELRAVYAHLLSLENFGKLLDLTQQRPTPA